MINPTDLFGVHVPLAGPDGEPLMPFAPVLTPAAFAAHFEAMGEGLPAEALFSQLPATVASPPAASANPPAPLAALPDPGPGFPAAGPAFVLAPTLDRPAAAAFQAAGFAQPAVGNGLAAAGNPILARLVVPQGAERPNQTGAPAPGQDLGGRQALALAAADRPAEAAGLGRDTFPGALAGGRDLGPTAYAAGEHHALAAHLRTGSAHAPAAGAVASFGEGPIDLRLGGQVEARPEAASEDAGHPTSRVRGQVEPDMPVVTPGVVLPLITAWLERRDDAFLAERDRRKRRRQEDEQEEEDSGDAPTAGAFTEIAAVFSSLFHGWPSTLTRGVWIASSWLLFGAFRLAGRAARGLFRWRANRKNAGKQGAPEISGGRA